MSLEFLNFLKKHQTFLLVAVIYLSCVFIVAPWGNYAVGDDLYYQIQVKAFDQGIFIKNGHIDTSIILQIFLGLFWGKIFGFSFISLKILSIIFGVYIIFILTKIFEFLKISKNLSIFGILVIIFYPKLFQSTLAFNSEVYFLAFFLSALYFLLLYNQELKFNYLIFTVLFAGASVSIRQHGVLFIIPILLVIYLNRKKILFQQNIYKLLSIFLVFLTLSSIGIFWPKQVTEYQKNSLSVLGVINYRDLLIKAQNLWLEIPYVSLILSPFFLFLYKKTTERSFKIWSLFLSLILGYFIYVNNVFGIGNFLYLEGFDARSYTSIRENIFNNNFFKLFFSFSFALIFVLFSFNIKNFIKNKKKDLNLIIISFVSFIYLSSTFLASVLYDRYFLYFEITLLLVFIYSISDLKFELEFKNISLLLIYLFITVIFSYDFHTDLKLKWDIAYKLALDKNLSPRNVFVNDNYLKYNFIDSNQDFLGLRAIRPRDPEYKCFVLTSVKKRDKFEIFRIINLIPDYLIKNNYLTKPTIEGYGFSKSQVNSCSSCAILKEVEYYSPLYEIYGSTKVIKAYCLNE